MKKIIYTLSALVFITMACTKDVSTLNTDPKNPAVLPSYAFFTNAQRTFSNTLASSNVNLNIFRLIVQHWQETQYPEESQYDLGTREINDNIWNALYRDVIRDLRESKALIPTDVADATTQKNQLAIVEIMEIYAWYYLVTTFGDIPYTEALDIDKPFPVYDDAQTIYNDLLARLDLAVGDLDISGSSFGGADLVYQGDVAKWKKFGNSLKIKMGMTIVDVDPATAESVVESAYASGAFTSNEDNATLTYTNAPPNTNPIWVDLVQSGRDDFVAASTLIDEMKTLKDPRINDFFTTDQSGTGYSGADPGVQSAYAQYSHVHPDITRPEFPGVFLDYAETELFLAEAAQRGFNVGETAKEHYDQGVTASILYWGGTVVEATAYLSQPAVASSATSYKQKIGIQKWIALFNRGWDAWIEWRRLDYPQLEKAHDALTDIPLRYPYPVNEQNVNRTNFEAASDAIGGDDVTTKLWWDVY